MLQGRNNNISLARLYCSSSVTTALRVAIYMGYLFIFWLFDCIQMDETEHEPCETHLNRDTEIEHSEGRILTPLPISMMPRNEVGGYSL